MDRESNKETPVRAEATRSPGPEPSFDLEALFRDHHKRAFRAAYRIVGNLQDAEDVVQTVFLKIARRDVPPDLSRTPGSYIHRAAVNAALDQVRSPASKRQVPLEQTPDEKSRAPLSSDPEEIHREKEMQRHLTDALGTISAHSAEVFALRYFEGLGNTEIARIVGSTRSAVAVTLHRARAQLKEKLSRHLGDTS